jgi:hypothetical protein
MIFLSFTKTLTINNTIIIWSLNDNLIVWRPRLIKHKLLIRIFSPFLCEYIKYIYIYIYYNKLKKLCDFFPYKIISSTRK